MKNLKEKILSEISDRKCIKNNNINKNNNNYYYYF